MDFGLDKKHEMARTLFKEFAENEVKPLAQEVDETEVFPAPDITPAPCPLLAEFVFFVVVAFELFAGFLVTTEVVPP